MTDKLMTMRDFDELIYLLANECLAGGNIFSPVYKQDYQNILSTYKAALEEIASLREEITRLKSELCHA